MCEIRESESPSQRTQVEDESIIQDEGRPSISDTFELVGAEAIGSASADEQRDTDQEGVRSRASNTERQEKSACMRHEYATGSRLNVSKFAQSEPLVQGANNRMQGDVKGQEVEPPSQLPSDTSIPISSGMSAASLPSPPTETRHQDHEESSGHALPNPGCSIHGQMESASPRLTFLEPQSDYPQLGPDFPVINNIPGTPITTGEGYDHQSPNSVPALFSPLPLQYSQRSSPVSNVPSLQLSSPLFVPSSPLTSSSPLIPSRPSSPFAAVLPESAIPELSLVESPNKDAPAVGDLTISADGNCSLPPLPRYLTAEMSGPSAELGEASNLQERRGKIMNHAPPNPKRPTPASQRKQHEKLSKPFRPPCLIKPRSDNPRTISQSDMEGQFPREARHRDGPLNDIVKAEAQEAVKQARNMNERHRGKHRTARAGAQFKSPLIIGGDNPKATSPIRLTPTIQILERKLQMLKRAIKIREDSQEEVLRNLITKWTEVGRDVAWEVWVIVKDNVHERSDDGSSAINGKRVFRNDWNWEMGDDKRYKRGGEEFAPPGIEDNELEEADTMRRADLMGMSAEDEDLDRSSHTLGTMLRQLGIDPQTLRWDDEEEIFKEVDGEV